MNRRILEAFRLAPPCEHHQKMIAQYGAESFSNIVPVRCDDCLMTAMAQADLVAHALDLARPASASSEEKP